MKTLMYGFGELLITFYAIQKWGCGFSFMLSLIEKYNNRAFDLYIRVSKSNKYIDVQAKDLRKLWVYEHTNNMFKELP